jgi:hypothetical protein
MRIVSLTNIEFFLISYFVCALWNAGPDDVFDFGQRVSFLFTFPMLIYYVPTRISLRGPTNTLRNGKVFLLDLTDLSNAKDTNTFSLCICVQAVSPSRQCNYALPSHPTLLFSFRALRVFLL